MTVGPHYIYIYYCPRDRCRGGGNPSTEQKRSRYRYIYILSFNIVYYIGREEWEGTKITRTVYTPILGCVKNFIICTTERMTSDLGCVFTLLKIGFLIVNGPSGSLRTRSRIWERDKSILYV